MAHFHQGRLIWIRIPGTEICPQNGYSNHLGNYPYRDPNLNPNQWKKLCIIQCNDRVCNPNLNPNPSPSPLVEMSHYTHCGCLIVSEL